MSTVVLYDRWWNPAVENQAIQRAHRFGRDRPMQVVRFLFTESIEERIDTLLREKQVIFEQYVEQAENATVPGQVSYLGNFFPTFAGLASDRNEH